MHLCHVLTCPPGFEFSPPAIVPNITRLGNRSLLYRATAPSKKSRRLRMVVSMLSQRVILRAWPVLEGGVVGTKSALEATGSQDDLVVRS